MGEPMSPAMTAHRIHLLLIPEDDGGFSAVALNLPGAGSCGDTEEEAVSNAEEAVLGVLESYAADGVPPPWAESSSEPIPEGCWSRWVTVHA